MHLIDRCAMLIGAPVRCWCLLVSVRIRLSSRICIYTFVYVCVRVCVCGPADFLMQVAELGV
jgi:choline-glycine betaine transporter